MAPTILVIDDDETMVELVQLSLRKLGFEVVGARNGEQGLGLFHELGPDLVTLDVLMPGIDGWEVCRRLRNVSSVPIMFLTVLDAEQNVVRGLDSGADDYLSKPFQVAELRARVAALLRRSQPLPLDGRDRSAPPSA
jgi:DNA-binding response OmpR family regulator